MNTPSEPDRDVVALEGVLRVSRRLEDAPESAIQRVIDVWQRKPRKAAAAATEAAPGQMRRILADLGFDSAAALPMAFGRRERGGTVRQLLFSADGQDIDLRLSPDVSLGQGSWVLAGQVLGTAARGRAELADELGDPAGQAELNDLGEFRLAPVGAGRYTLRLLLSDREIVLPAIDVPQAS